MNYINGQTDERRGTFKNETMVFEEIVAVEAEEMLDESELGDEIEALTVEQTETI